MAPMRHTEISPMRRSERLQSPTVQPSAPLWTAPALRVSAAAAGEGGRRRAARDAFNPSYTAQDLAAVVRAAVPEAKLRVKYGAPVAEVRAPVLNLNGSTALWLHRPVRAGAER